MYYIRMRGMRVMSFSIRLSDEQRDLAESYARLHSYSLAEAFKSALFEKIEDDRPIVLALSVGHRSIVYKG